jgi:hypothetical protein
VGVRKEARAYCFLLATKKSFVRNCWLRSLLADACSGLSSFLLALVLFGWLFVFVYKNKKRFHPTTQ